MIVRFDIPGRAVPKARPRVTARGTFTPKKSREYEALVASIAKMAMMENGATRTGGPVGLVITINYALPKSWSKKKKQKMGGRPHTSKPDLDNLLKSIKDGLNGIAYEDDSQVARVEIDKKWSDQDVTLVDIIW